MTSTQFLRNMLLNADALQKEFDNRTQYPLIFLLAVLRFCKQDYRGFSEIESAEPVLYEEERLRFLLRKVFLRGSTATARMIEYLLKKRREELAPAISREEMLIEVNELAKLRKYSVMSVELMLAVVLAHLPPQSDSLLQPTFRNGNVSARALMDETEREIYDYVMEEIRTLTEKLQQKAKEAKEHRDWRPARMFAPLSEIEEKLNSAIAMEEVDGQMQITIPYFFADTGNSLYLTVFETEEGYVAHDNGGAIAELSVHLQGGNWQEIAHKICAGTVCHIEENYLTVCFTDPHSLLTFLQYISIVAHADLYLDYDPRGNCYMVNPHYLSLPLKSVTDYSQLVAGFRKYMGAIYDEYLGICVGLGVVFLGSNTGSRYVLSTDEQGIVTITDHSNSYNEGAVLENYLNYHEESPQAWERIATLAKRFDGICHSDTVSCTFVNNSEDAFIRAMHRFVQMGVILSQVGYHIPVDSHQTPSNSDQDREA